MIYLDNAATSYQKPERVLRRTCEAMYKECANPGRSGHDLSVSAGEILYETRKRLAELFNINTPERITFCQNTTEALNKGIKGVMARGGHVITTSMEHNSVIRPIVALKKYGVTHSILHADENGEIDVNEIENLIRRDTKLIVMTRCSNVCGNVYDIKKASEIAHAKKVLLMVDGAQAAGCMDIDLNDIDLFAFPGHKGLMAPMGTGGLYIREGISPETIIEGGTGSVSESLLQPDFFPDAMESGTMNVPAIAGLGVAAEFIKSVGAERIREHEKVLREIFERKISAIDNIKIYGGKSRNGISAFNILNKDCVDVAQTLNDDFGICVRAGLHCSYLAHKSLKTDKTGCVRVSFGYFNTEQEAEYAADAIIKIAKKA